MKGMDKVMNQDLLTVTHLGENPDKYMNAVVPPVFMNSLHVFDTYEKQSTVNLKEDFVYGRTANPTTTILEKKIAALQWYGSRNRRCLFDRKDRGSYHLHEKCIFSG